MYTFLINNETKEYAVKIIFNKEKEFIFPIPVLKHIIKECENLYEK